MMARYVANAAKRARLPLLQAAPGTVNDLAVIAVVVPSQKK